ncbi:hypothetical protein Tco_0781025 [Tanacetum coccineum]
MKSFHNSHSMVSIVVVGGWFATLGESLEEYGVEKLLGVPFPIGLTNGLSVAVPDSGQSGTFGGTIIPVRAPFPQDLHALDKKIPSNESRTRDNNVQCCGGLVGNFTGVPDNQ